MQHRRAGMKNKYKYQAFLQGNRDRAWSSRCYGMGMSKKNTGNPGGGSIITLCIIDPNISPLLLLHLNKTFGD